jgi:outer membrane protein assembly factor BamA
MKLSLVAILFICLTGLSADAQSFRLQVENSSGEELPFKPKAVFTTVTLRKEALKQYIFQLQEDGYLAAGLDSTSGIEADQIAYVFLGYKFIWSKLYSINADEPALNAGGYKGKFYNDRPFKLRQTKLLLQRMLGYYENNGYPFAQIKFDSLQTEDGILKAGIRVEKGELIRIDSITVRGDVNINSKYLYNYIGIEPGDLYNEKVISAMSTRLKELPFLTEVRPTEIFLLDNAALIRLYLDGRKASNFNGIIGFLPNNQATGKLLLTGEANLRLKNSLGRGETIIAEWRRLQTATQSLNIQLAVPFIFNTRIGVDGYFGLYKRDTTFLNLNQNIGIQYLMKGTDYLKVFYENKSSSLLSTRGLENVIVLPDNADTRTGQYGLELSLTKLDYRLNPRKGYRILSRIGAGNRVITKNSGLNPQIYEGLKLKSLQYSGFIDADFYFPIRAKSVFTPSILGGLIGGVSMFENELFRIGGNSSLRGFNEESIFASAYSIINLEYRYLIEENAFLFLFANGAYYENRAVNRNIEDRPYGFGAGMSFETKAGIFSISYALGSQFGNPVETRTAKVHFGLTSLF